MPKRNLTAHFLAFILLSGLCFGQEESGPAIEPRADEILRGMSDYLAKIREFGFAVEDSFDEILESGYTLRFSNARRVGVRRPDKLVSTVRGDVINRNAWYDGKTIALLDNRHNLYATLEAPETIDDTLDFLAENFDVVLPLADLLYSNSYQAVIDRIESGFYVGLHQVRDWKCHHLAFSQEFVDWQIWIEAGEKPIPRKLVLTYKEVPGQPQYEAVVTQWRDALKLPDETFRFAPPSGAEKIEMPKLLESQKSKAKETPEGIN